MVIDGSTASQQASTSRPFIRKAQLPQSAATPFDRTRAIGPAPGETPWSELPQGERGVAQGLPVAYGTNPLTEPALHTGLDEVKRELGEAPNSSTVTVREGRDMLPSLERRNNAQRLRSLATLGVLIVVSVVGLVWVASVAFG